MLLRTGANFPTGGCRMDGQPSPEFSLLGAFPVITNWYKPTLWNLFPPHLGPGIRVQAFFV